MSLFRGAGRKLRYCDAGGIDGALSLLLLGINLRFDYAAHWIDFQVRLCPDPVNLEYGDFSMPVGRKLVQTKPVIGCIQVCGHTLVGDARCPCPRRDMMP